MKQETAVEWLEKQLQKEEYIEKFGCVIYIINQAKEMEKQQIIDAHMKGHNASSSTIKHFDAEQYYNQTYNNENTNNN
jgi:hypothetical protein